MNNKIITKSQFKNLLKKSEKRPVIVFTNGCFDILHYGHIRYLRAAKAKGDLLIVGVNSDISVRKIKGKNRPINPLRERVEVLAALEMIDYIVTFSEPTPFRLIKALRPDILVKGGDWKKSQIVGADIVLANKGRVLSIPYVKNRSTTNTIKKLIERD